MSAAGGAAPQDAGGRVLGEELASVWRSVAEWQGEGRWFEEEPPARRYLLRVPSEPRAGRSERGLLPYGKVGMLAAGGGVGKTMALTQLAVAVATGRPWLARSTGEGGFLTPEGGGRVLLVLGEEDPGEVRRRLFLAAQALAFRPGERERAAQRIVALPLASFPSRLMLPADPAAGLDTRPSPLVGEILSRLSDGGPWELVILDPLSRFGGPDTETDASAATAFVQVLESFSKAPGEPTVLVAHHTTKAARREGSRDGTGARGSSALTDGVRWQAEITSASVPEGASDSLPRMAVFEVTKSNYAAPLDAPLWLVRGPHGELGAASRDERERYAAAIEAAEAAREAKKKAGRAKSAARGGDGGAGAVGAWREDPP